MLVGIHFIPSNVCVNQLLVFHTLFVGNVPAQAAVLVQTLNVIQDGTLSKKDLIAHEGYIGTHIG